MTHNTGYLDFLEFKAWLHENVDAQVLEEFYTAANQKWKKKFVDKPLTNDQEEDFHGDFQLYNAEWHFSYGNINHIVDLLKFDQELTWRTREFIADILSGKLKRKNNRSRYPENELLLFDQFQRCLNDDPKIHLRSSRNTKDGVGDIVGKRFRKSGDAAIKAYQKIKKELDKESEKIKITDPDEIKKLSAIFALVDSVLRSDDGIK